MEESAYEAAICGSGNHINEAKTAQKEAKRAAAGLIEGKLFAISDVTCEVKVNANDVIVSYSGNVNMPFVTWLSEYISDTDFSINISQKARRSHQTKTIRSCRVLNRLIPD